MSTEADQFDAFDTLYLNEDISLELIRNCTIHLLDKLPKNFSQMSKPEILDKLSRCLSDDELMEQVLIFGAASAHSSVTDALLPIRYPVLHLLIH